MLRATPFGRQGVSIDGPAAPHGGNPLGQSTAILQKPSPATIPPFSRFHGEKQPEGRMRQRNDAERRT